MTKLIDFDQKYMAFVAKALKDMGDPDDEALEGTLNDTVSRWLNTADDELGGRTPDEYFAGMSPEELVASLAAYGEGSMNVPEPLYRRIAATSACAPGLFAIARNGDLREKARGTARRLLCDMEAENLPALNADMLLEGGEIGNEAAEWLKAAGYGIVDPLLHLYERADEEAREAILDVLSAYPGVEKTAEILAERLLSDHERRAVHAIFAARLGDQRLLKPLAALYGLSELTYFDYMEIRNAIEAIGGEPGEERQFYGDPDYERLREEPE